MGKIKFTYEASRWAKMGDFIKQLALICDVECKIEVSKTWFNEDGVVVCEAEDEKILKFKRKLESSLKEHNS